MGAGCGGGVSAIDLNADLGEGYGAWRMGDDAAMLDIVTSANVACGFHAGDPDIMARTFALAREKGVAVGAHVSFPDLAGFGRRPLPMSAAEIERAVAYQLGAAMGVAALSGHRIAYVKAHGALANLAERDAGIANAVARAVAAVDASLILLCIALTEQIRAAERAKLGAAHEIFADRAYAEDGGLLSRKEQGAVIVDEAEAVRRSLAMLEAGAIITISGRRLETPIQSICVHGDTPGAVAMAQRLRAALVAAGRAPLSFARREP
jgi:5-oxoprolinase (ATP-hydrolysing) subunit A